MSLPRFHAARRAAATLKLTGAGAASLLMLAACGGGDASTSGAAPALPPLQISGVVVDGPIEGAVVFLDLNGNYQHDWGEPASAQTDARGAFALTVDRASAAQLDGTMLVSHVVRRIHLPTGLAAFSQNLDCVKGWVVGWVSSLFAAPRLSMATTNSF